MLDKNQIYDTIDKLFSQIEFEKEPQGLYDPLRYMIGIGGKRIRPQLCLMVYSIYSDLIDEKILSPLEAIEVFHTFTLIHDDIMDRSPLRRRRPTVWVKWSEDHAILSGDVMLIDAYRRIAKAPTARHNEVMSLFSKTAAQVCEGQQYDMDFEQRPDVSIEDYKKMIGLKTAVLLACSAQMGAIIANAPQDACEAFYRYGYELGMAFQIADDYLDTYGDESVFGKPIGGDIINCKKSWLTVSALEKTPKREDFLKVFNTRVEGLEEKSAKIASIKQFYDELEIPSAAREEIARYSDMAIKEISSLGLSQEALSLIKDFTDGLVARAR